MHPQNPNYAKQVKQIFEGAPYIQGLGIKLKECRPGLCETTLETNPGHLQQSNVIHAGILATLADHTAGAAAATLIKAEQSVLTVEFKINFLRPAEPSVLHCRSKVLKPGQTFMVVESDIFSLVGYQKTFHAKALVTLAIVTPGN